MNRTAPPSDDRAALCEALSLLERARLTHEEWERVEATLTALRSELDTGDGRPTVATVTALGNLAFGARVRQRLDHPRRSAPVVAPTKPSRALPIVGTVCAALLLGLGWALGGGVLLAGTALFAGLVLIVAVTGTTGFSTRRAEGSSPPDEDPVSHSAPPPVADAIGELRATLACG